MLGGLVVRTYGVQTTTSYQTGTVLRTTKGIAEWLFGGGDTSGVRRVAGVGLLCLTSYAIGGFVGAATQRKSIWTLAISWAVVVATIALTWGKTAPNQQNAPQ